MQVIAVAVALESMQINQNPLHVYSKVHNMLMFGTWPSAVIRVNAEHELMRDGPLTMV